MSIQAIEWAISFEAENATEKAVLFMLANYADGNGICFPGQQNIAKQAACSERSVRRVLDSLEERGVIRREERRRRDGSRTSDAIVLVQFAQADNLAGSQKPTGQSVKTNRPICQNQPDTVTGLTSFEPSGGTSASRADADGGSAAGAISLQKRLVEAADGKIQPHAALVIGEFYELMNRGVDLETDILPTIQAVAAKMNTVASTWSYFIRPIKEAHNRRIEAGKGLSQPKVSTIKRDADMTDAERRARLGKLLNLARSTGIWLTWMNGPPPGSDGCRIPADMLEPRDMKREWFEELNRDAA